MWRVAWRYVGYWIASRDIGSVVGVGCFVPWHRGVTRRTGREHVFVSGAELTGHLKSHDPRRRERGGRKFHLVSPRFLSSGGGRWEGSYMDWEHGVVQPVPLERLGQRYRRYRLADLKPISSGE